MGRSKGHVLKKWFWRFRKTMNLLNRLVTDLFSIVKVPAIRFDSPGIAGGLIHELRTFFRHTSIAPIIQQLSQLTA